jgi:hypothetical protein
LIESILNIGRIDLEYTLEKPQPAPQPVRIYLKNDKGGVHIMAEDVDGDYWHIATLTKGGTLNLATHLHEHLGFKVEPAFQHCIMVTRED